MDSDGLGWTRMDSDGLGMAGVALSTLAQCGFRGGVPPATEPSGGGGTGECLRVVGVGGGGLIITDIAGRPAVGEEAAQHRREQDGRLAAPLAAPLAAAIAPLLLLSQADRSGGPDLRQLSRSTIPLSISMPATSPDSSPLAL